MSLFQYNTIVNVTRHVPLKSLFRDLQNIQYFFLLSLLFLKQNNKATKHIFFLLFSEFVLNRRGCREGSGSHDGQELSVHSNIHRTAAITSEL